MLAPPHPPPCADPLERHAPQAAHLPGARARCRGAPRRRHVVRGVQPHHHGQHRRRAAADPHVRADRRSGPGSGPCRRRRSRRSWPPAATSGFATVRSSPSGPRVRSCSTSTVVDRAPSGPRRARSTRRWPRWACVPSRPTCRCRVRSRSRVRDCAIVVRTPQTVDVLVDGKRREVVTTAAAVSEVLTQVGVKLAPTDQVSAALDAVPAEGDVIEVTRVSGSRRTTSAPVKFSTVQKKSAKYLTRVPFGGHQGTPRRRRQGDRDPPRQRPQGRRAGGVDDVQGATGHAGGRDRDQADPARRVEHRRAELGGRLPSASRAGGRPPAAATGSTSGSTSSFRPRGVPLVARGFRAMRLLPSRPSGPSGCTRSRTGARSGRCAARTCSPDPGSRHVRKDGRVSAADDPRAGADVQLLGAVRIRELAEQLDLRPTKQRGQNFVVDANTVRRIVRAADLDARRRGARGRTRSRFAHAGAAARSGSGDRGRDRRRARRPHSRRRWRSRHRTSRIGSRWCTPMRCTSRV